MATRARARDSREPPARPPHRRPGQRPRCRCEGPGSSGRCSPAACCPDELVSLNASPQRPSVANTSTAPPAKEEAAQPDGTLARLGKRVCNHQPGKRRAAFEPSPAGTVLTSCRDEQAPNFPTRSLRAGGEQTGPQHGMGTPSFPGRPPHPPPLPTLLDPNPPRAGEVAPSRRIHDACWHTGVAPNLVAFRDGGGMEITPRPPRSKPWHFPLARAQPARGK